MAGSTVRRDTTKRPIRVDAQRSRQLILTAAAETFLRDGAYASLEEIAKSAGVGSATLYRHFPSRWDLLESVFAEGVRSLCEEASLASEGSSPGEALAAWLHSVCAHLAATRGLADALLQADAAAGRQTGEGCLKTFADAGAPLLERARATGAVRAEVSITELLLLVGGIVLAAEHGPVASDRLLTLAIEGIAPTMPG